MSCEVGFEENRGVPPPKSVFQSTFTIFKKPNDIQPLLASTPTHLRTSVSTSQVSTQLSSKDVDKVTNWLEHTT